MLLQNLYLLSKLRDPADGSAYHRINSNYIHFLGGNSYPITRGVPILINEQTSLFSIKDILENKPTTQTLEYRSPKHWKNYVRQRILPSFSVDTTIYKRYSDLSTKIQGGPVLIIGAGDKSDFYRNLFPKSDVVISDVHCQFNPDLILDAHSIPFNDHFFALVIAAQVLEHTSRPWIVATEIQRVTKLGGYIQVEIPFAFPYHSPPYDFYRFTPSSLRFLFSQSKVTKFEVPEGNYSGAAIAISNAFINSFDNKFLRRSALVAARLLLWWMKYLDRLSSRHDLSMPKGFSITYSFDGNDRDEKHLLEEVRQLLDQALL